jgi:hypothetical protein
MINRSVIQFKLANACVFALLSWVDPIHAQQEVLFGVTSTNLVRINPDNPSQVTTIGPHNIASVYPNAVPVFALTYDPTIARLFGIARRPFSGNDFEYGLISFNMSSGQASLVTTAGTHLTGNPLEGFEYVNSQQSLVISRGVSANISLSEDLLKLALDGTKMPIVKTPGHDNDTIVYDSTRDLFYGIDPNDPSGAEQFVRIDLMTGNRTSLGAIPMNMGDVAYSASRDAIFGADFTNNQLYRITTTNGGAPITPIAQMPVGTIAGSQVTGIAFAVIPEPMTISLVGTASGFIVLGCFRIRRRTS